MEKVSKNVSEAQTKDHLHQTDYVSSTKNDVKAGVS